MPWEDQQHLLVDMLCVTIKPGEDQQHALALQLPELKARAFLSLLKKMEVYREQEMELTIVRSGLPEPTAEDMDLVSTYHHFKAPLVVDFAQLRKEIEEMDEVQIVASYLSTVHGPGLSQARDPLQGYDLKECREALLKMLAVVEQQVVQTGKARVPPFLSNTNILYPLDKGAEGFPRLKEARYALDALESNRGLQPPFATLYHTDLENELTCVPQLEVGRNAKGELYLRETFADQGHGRVMVEGNDVRPITPAELVTRVHRRTNDESMGPAQHVIEFLQSICEAATPEEMEALAPLEARVRQLELQTPSI